VAFYQKYRPKKFAELLGEDHVRDTLREAIRSDKMSHAYLLCGPRGIGKTTTARLLAKAFNCQEIEDLKNNKNEFEGEPCNKCESCLEVDDGRAVDVIEIDAASHTKVDEIREIIDKAQFAPVKAKRKIYIIDEVHMLSNSSFNALLKTLEEPPKHVIFILATTESHKLPATILSRVQRYDFKRVTKSEIIKNLKKIAKAEELTANEDALDLIAIHAEGGHRDAITLFEQVAAVSKEITKENVSAILGISGVDNILLFIGAIFSNNPEEGLKIAHGQYEKGASMSQFNKSVIEYLRRILLIKIVGTPMFEDTAENIEKIKKLSEEASEPLITKTLDIFIKNGQLLKDISYPLLPIEMGVVEAAQNKKSNIKNKNDLKTEEKEGKEEKKQANGEDSISTKDKTKEIENTELSATDPKLQTPDPQLPTPDLVSVPVFQMTSDIWQKVINAVKKENVTLAALLRDAKPMDVKGNKIELGVKFAFHKDKISEPKNCAMLEKTINEIIGQKCIINCKVIAGKKEPAKKLNDDELQKAAEEIFTI